MNSCILMVEIYDNPQLRHTPEGLEVTEMIVHVPGTKPDEPAHPLKVVSWGNLAKEVHQNYHQGDRVIIEGRLGMNTIERSEGFKEKRADLTIQKIHLIGQVSSHNSSSTTTRTVPSPQTPVAQPTAQPTYYPPTTQTPPEPPYQQTYQPAPVQPAYTEPVSPDPDDIPF